MEFGGLAPDAAEIAKILFCITLANCGMFIMAGLILAGKLTS